MKKLTTQQQKELFDNLGWEGMEAIIFDDGSIEYRQVGSFGDYEEEITKTIPLSITYWRDTLIDWNLYNEESDSIKEEAEEKLIIEFAEENF